MTTLSILEWAILLLAALSSVELIARLPIARHARQLGRVPGRVLGMMRGSSKSDELKQRLLLLYARVLAGASLALAAWLLLALLPLLLVLYGLGGGVDQAMRLALDAAVLTVLTATAVLYLALRRRWHG